LQYRCIIIFYKRYKIKTEAAIIKEIKKVEVKKGLTICFLIELKKNRKHLYFLLKSREIYADMLKIENQWTERLV